MLFLKSLSLQHWLQWKDYQANAALDNIFEYLIVKIYKGNSLTPIILQLFTGLVSYNSESESESEQNVLESKLPTSNISGILPGDVPDDVKHDYTSHNSPSNESKFI